MKIKNTKIKKVTLTALLAALCVISTLIYIPFSAGFVNLGDCLMLLSGFMLGPLYGGIAAGLGSAAADLLLGYAIYTPATLLLKASGAAVFALIIRRHPGSRVTRFWAALAAEAIVSVGYFLWELIIYAQVTTALVSALGSLVQSAIAIAGIMLLTHAADKIHLNKL